MITSLKQCLAEALEAHREFDPDEVLGHVSIGKYNDDDSGYYWHINAERRRVLGDPSSVTRGTHRSIDRKAEVIQIINAYEEARARLDRQCIGCHPNPTDHEDDCPLAEEGS